MSHPIGENLQLLCEASQCKNADALPHKTAHHVTRHGFIQLLRRISGRVWCAGSRTCESKGNIKRNRLHPAANLLIPCWAALRGTAQTVWLPRIEWRFTLFLQGLLLSLLCVYWMIQTYTAARFAHLMKDNLASAHPFLLSGEAFSSCTISQSVGDDPGYFRLPHVGLVCDLAAVRVVITAHIRMTFSHKARPENR